MIFEAIASSKTVNCAKFTENFLSLTSPFVLSQLQKAFSRNKRTKCSSNSDATDTADMSSLYSETQGEGPGGVAGGGGGTISAPIKTSQSDAT